jgi:hypothetical protein
MRKTFAPIALNCAHFPQVGDPAGWPALRRARQHWQHASSSAKTGLANGVQKNPQISARSPIGGHLRGGRLSDVSRANASDKSAVVDVGGPPAS